MYRAFKNKGVEFALFAVTIFASFSLSFVIAGSVMTESALIMSHAMIFLSFYSVVIDKQESAIDKWMFFLGCAIALMTKSLFGIALPGMVIFVYLLITKQWRDFFTKFPMIIGGVLTICLVLPWFIIMENRHPGFLNYSIIGEHFYRFLKPGWKGDLYGHAHDEPIGMIWLFFLACHFPWILHTIYSVYCAVITKTKLSFKEIENSNLFFLIALFLPLIFFTFARNIILRTHLKSF